MRTLVSIVLCMLLGGVVSALAQEEATARLEPPVPRPAGAGVGGGIRGRQMKPGNGPGRPAGPPRDAVVLPMGNKRAIIPTGISEADYDLLLGTLALWKDKIVKA